MILSTLTESNQDLPPPPEKKTHPKTYNNSTVEIGIMNIEQALEGQQVNINVCIHVVYQNK